MSGYILSIDQGTSGTNAAIYDRELKFVSRGYSELDCAYPKSGWVEQDPEALWKSTLKAISSALENASVNPKDIISIGITNQRETTILWDTETSKPVYEAIVWQCRRSADICTELKNNNLEEEFHLKTGLLLDPYFSGTKIKWILDYNGLHQRARSRGIKFGTVDTWLIHKLTGGKQHVTDTTNASRTLLMNLETLQWDKDLCNHLNIPMEILPEIKPSAGIFGYTSGCDILPDGIPISGVIGDQQSALFGQGAFRFGEAKCTYGTGSFLMMNIGEKPSFNSHGILTTVGWSIGDKTVYALEGSAFVAGAAVQWLRDGLKLISTASEIESLALTVSDSGGVFFVPALTGLGAPYWKTDARGMFWGITRGTKQGHFARAVLEGIALQNLALLKLMEETAGEKISMLKVDGGAAANNVLMQFQSDILETPLFRPANLESTAFGAAAMSAIGVELCNGVDEIAKNIIEEKIFYPSMDKESVIHYTNFWEEMVKKV
ncbi:MAG: glycerol kinase GlpK [Deltaproteobacteria bacterium]|nr:glycerol kinase GlpK [Deltaproteobacteria bacterium]